MTTNPWDTEPETTEEVMKAAMDLAAQSGGAIHIEGKHEHDHQLPDSDKVERRNPLWRDDYTPTLEERKRYQYDIDAPPRQCAICGEFNITGVLRVCDACWKNLYTVPQVHLRLMDSDKYKAGVVVWDHNSIGSIPYDPNPVAVGVWGMYGMDGTNLTYWVSLCKPIEAIHDMMTQFTMHIREDNDKWTAEYSKGVDSTGAPKFVTRRTQSPRVAKGEQPAEQLININDTAAAEAKVAFTSLRDRLMAKKKI